MTTTAQDPRRVVRRSGSTFLPAFLFLSPPQRAALRAVYAFCRVVDDAGDLLEPAAAAIEVAFWRDELERCVAGQPETATGVALAQALRRHAIAPEALREVVRGVEMDLRGERYRTMAELTVYLRRVASAVGHACLAIFDARSAAAAEYADRLGIALQFTNILRDLVEDRQRGRVYLPAEDLERFGLDDACLLGAAGDKVAALLRFEVARAQALFAAATAALPPGEARALLPARIMSAAYREVLARIARAGPAHLDGRRVRLSRPELLLIAVETWLLRRPG